MDPINIPPMLVYIPYMDPMGIILYYYYKDMVGGSSER
jgi:hypothetical protein